MPMHVILVDFKALYYMDIEIKEIDLQNKFEILIEGL